MELLTWFLHSLLALGVNAKVWLAADGAYATRPFLRSVMKRGIVVVSRLRKNACWFDLPGPDAHGNRIDGKNQLRLAKRAGHPEGWQPITYPCRGVEVTHEYKTLVASSRLVSGPIRVVLVRFESGGWASSFCSDPSAEVLTFWRRMVRAGRSRNTFMTSRKSGAPANSRSGTCGRTYAVGL